MLAAICSQSIPKQLLAQAHWHGLCQLVVPLLRYQLLDAPALLYVQGMQAQSADLLYATCLGSRCTYTYVIGMQTRFAEAQCGL